MFGLPSDLHSAESLPFPLAETQVPVHHAVQVAEIQGFGKLLAHAPRQGNQTHTLLGAVSSFGVGTHLFAVVF